VGGPTKVEPTTDQDLSFANRRMTLGMHVTDHVEGGCCPTVFVGCDWWPPDSNGRSQLDDRGRLDRLESEVVYGTSICVMVILFGISCFQFNAWMIMAAWRSKWKIKATYVLGNILVNVLFKLLLI
jgi:hypothetical protein